MESMYIGISRTFSARCRTFRRSSELVLAAFGASISVGIAAVVWRTESGPGGEFWPLPALFLLELGVLGLIGLAAIVLDSEENSIRWGSVSWATIGGLGAVMLLGAFSIGPMVFPVVLAFSIAGVLADLRRGRRILENIGLATVFGIGNLLLLLTLVLANLD